MATRKETRTVKIGSGLRDILKSKGQKVRQYKMDSSRSKLGNKPSHAYTDGRSSDVLKQRSPEYATTRNGRLGVVQRDENGNVTGISASKAKTNLFTPKNADGTYMTNSDGSRKNTGGTLRRDYVPGEDTKYERRTRDYYTRVGLNNDQRSEEAKARLEATLRSIGASEDEITALTGRGNGHPAPWRAVSTG